MSGVQRVRCFTFRVVACSRRHGLESTLYIGCELRLQGLISSWEPRPKLLAIVPARV